MKYYLDLSVVSEIPDAYQLSSERLMQISGLNLGNFAFRHALSSMFSNLSEYRAVTYPDIWQVLKAGEGIPEVIVSCANWLGVRDQDERSNKVRADTIEAINAPTYSFGLGLQAKPGAEDVDLGSESVRLAKVLASKSEFLSVRDELTARVLKKYDIDNVLVTGCPSNFINPDPNLGEKIVERACQHRQRGVSWGGIRTLISEFSGGHAVSGKVLQQCYRLLREFPAFYLVQAPTLLAFLLNEELEFPQAYSKNLPFPEQEVKQVFRRTLLHFASVPAWMDFSRSCHLATGMRIHGNMVPLQAGVPSLMVGHDSRTQGLASVMGIPAVDPDGFLSAVKDGPSRIFGIVEEHMETYDETRVRLAGLFRKMTASSELQLTEGFQVLCRD